MFEDFHMNCFMIKFRPLQIFLKPSSFFFFLIIVLFFPNSVLGTMNKGIHFYPDELRAMPRWCECRILWQRQFVGWSRDVPVPDSIKIEYKKWAKVIGEDIFRGTHHYCTGLNWINRYKLSLTDTYKNIENDRNIALNSALGEFRYMRGALKPKHRLYYEMLLNEAYIYSEQGNHLKAANNYIEILKLKPKYAGAYVKYAMFLTSIGQKEKAIKVLQAGFKKTNGSKIILQALTAMGIDNI